LLPKPQEIRYGTSRLRLEGLVIGFASSPTEQDRFAAGELAFRLEERAHVGVHVSEGIGAQRRIVLRRTGSGPDLPQPDERPGAGLARGLQDQSHAGMALKFARIHQRGCSMAFKPCSNW
jgi:hypothetical protein